MVLKHPNAVNVHIHSFGTIWNYIVLKSWYFRWIYRIILKKKIWNYMVLKGDKIRTCFRIIWNYMVLKHVRYWIKLKKFWNNIIGLIPIFISSNIMIWLLRVTTVVGISLTRKHMVAKTGRQYSCGQDVRLADLKALWGSTGFDRDQKTQKSIRPGWTKSRNSISKE